MRDAGHHIDVVQSWSNGILCSAVEEFARKFDQILTILPGTEFALFQNSAGVHRLTLPQLVRQLAQGPMADAGVAPLTSLGAEAVAARIVFQGRQEGTLGYFSGVAGLPGFARALARTLGELRLAGTTAPSLAAGGESGQALAVLLERYEDELDERGLVDPAAMLALAREAVEERRHPWAGLPVAALDVALDSRAHHEFFDALLAQTPRALVARLGPGEDPRADSLAHLRRNLFAATTETVPENDGKFVFFSAPGEGLEAVEIARRILRLARDGVPFDQVAIFLRNPNRYQPMIEDALRRAGIPALFSKGSARPDPAGRAFLALLTCAAENLSASRFAEYMSLGQIPQSPVPPEWIGTDDDAAREPSPESPKPTPRRWEQYLVDAAVIGGRDRWERRLQGLEAEWSLHAEPNAERLEHLRNLREFALPLIDTLAALPRRAPWRDWLEALGSLARQALRGPDAVLAALAELEPMGDVGPASLEEVIEVLSDRLRFLRQAPAERRWGKVFVASIDEARGREFGVVFLPGLAEGLFPQRLNEDPLLLDEFRRAVDPHLPLKEDRVHEERMRLHLAVAAARDLLVASYPRMEVAEARPRVPSFYALELPRAIHGVVPELSVFERAARNAAPARLNWPAPAKPVDAIDDAEYDLCAIAGNSAQHVLQANTHAARSLRARWVRWNNPHWRPADGLLVPPDTLAAERLAARTWSPSSLENFAVCPYKFALHGIYRLRVREEAAPLEQLDPMTRGSLFHAVQFALNKELQAAGLLPVTLESLPDAMTRLESALGRVATEFAERLAPAIPRVWDSEMEELRTDLRGWLHFTASNEFDWTPVEFELPFDEELPGVHLGGRIDLVEAHGELRRVTDTKTGKAPESIPRWTGGGKHLQPLLYAMAAEKKLGAPVESGRLQYATQRGGFTTVQIALDNRARAVMTALLTRIDEAIAGGFLPPVPEKDACKLCDYRVVCGPYEDQRMLKKHRDDPRLDGLMEIRGSA